MQTMDVGDNDANYNKCTTLVQDVGNAGGSACVGARGMRTLYTFFSFLLSTENITLKK